MFEFPIIGGTPLFRRPRALFAEDAILHVVRLPIDTAGSQALQIRPRLYIFLPSASVAWAFLP
jgi:hypothetical protein